MKRTLATLALAALALPVLAAELPYEQINIDRSLPTVAERSSEDSDRVRPSFEQYNPV